MFNKIRTFLAGVLAAAAWLVHGSAAAVVVVTGSGTWDATAPSSSISAPGATWSFSFLLPDLIAQNPTTAASSFSYSLDGIPVAAAPASIQFFAPVDSGGFDINFVGGATFSLYTQALLTAQSLTLGSFDVFTGLAGGLPVGSGTVSLVPEPAGALSLALGLVPLGLLALVRRRRAVAPV
jgi:hypothetical protein